MSKRYHVHSATRFHSDYPAIVPAGEYDTLQQAIKHAETVTYKMAVIDSHFESRGFVYTNWAVRDLCDTCGADLATDDYTIGCPGCEMHEHEEVVK